MNTYQSKQVLFTNSEKIALSHAKKHNLCSFHFVGWINAPSYLWFDYVVCTKDQYQLFIIQFGDFSREQF